MKKILFTMVMVLAITVNAQTKEELEAQQAPKKESIAVLQGEVDALQSQIDALPGWKKGAFGTIGGNLSGFNNWYSREAYNSNAGNIGITINAFANLLEEKYFWRNSANVNLSWVKLDNKDVDGESTEDFTSATDVFNISSLYGRKISDKWAVSALGEYRTTILDNFNDPGYLDLGVGMTWTPMDNLVVVIHPLNYNFVFSDSDAVYDSSMGAKIVADYTTSIGAVNLKSNLSAFQSYKSSDLSSWTWINSFGYTLWKGIGVGLEIGLRNNKQEALGNALNNVVAGDVTPTFDSIDNDLQSYWLFGMNYAF